MKLLFIYGTLKRGKELHNSYLKNSEFVKKDSVYGKLYTLWGLPFLVLDKKKTSKVPGEIYNVTEKVFNEIRSMEEGANYKTVKVLTVGKESVYVFSYDKMIASSGGKRIKEW